MFKGFLPVIYGIICINSGEIKYQFKGLLPVPKGFFSYKLNNFERKDIAQSRKEYNQKTLAYLEPLRAKHNLIPPLFLYPTRPDTPRNNHPQ
jgi:hypothetical protein